MPGRSTDAAVARKVVTIVFADLIGSTALHERLDAESARGMMDRYYGVLREVVEAHRGIVVKLLGDGVMAAFGVPQVAEDDAIRAVRAALAIVEQVSGLGCRVSDPDTRHPTPDTHLSVRVAVNTGEVVVSSANDDVVGDPVNVAARLQQEAAPGDVLIGQATQRLVNDLVTLAPFGELSLKGRTETVAAYRVVSLERPAGAPTLAFVGRDDELRRITAVYDDAVAARAARLVVILGSPGLGKSRLIGEVTRRIGDRAAVVTAHCEAAGQSTFAPLAEALRALLRLDDAAGVEAVRAAIDSRMPGDAPERARITAGVAALVAGTPASPEETFFVVRRFLTALAATRPVVVAIDDVQWAEPLLLDLTEHLVQWTVDVPLLVLVAARPELRDVRSSLATAAGLVADVVTLGGLDAGAATRLAANAIGADELPAAVAGRVLATSEGNPLFVGELVRMLVHDGALKREGNRWTTTVELADLEMPPTIHALLAARIERLRPEERTVLERAAVVGRHFSRAAIVHLLPREMTDLDTRLESLRHSELIESDAGWFLGEPALRFHHALIRDAAYRRLLKGTRAELHGRFADWAEARVGNAAEHEETIGWHLEQAHQLLGELGAIDAAGRVFGERAARRLAGAGRRALERDDVARAANLLGRALNRLDASDPTRADLALDWCEALLTAGDVGPAAEAVAELGRFIAESERLRAWHTCFAAQLAVLTDPATLRHSAAAVATAAAALESLGDAAGEAKAHAVQAAALVRLGEVGACEAALDRALAAARHAGDRRRANAVLAGAPLAAVWGPSPVTRASGRCLDVVRVLRITQGAPAVEAVALRCQAVLEALRGRTEAARRMIASSRQMVEELGITPQLLETEMFAGLIELLEGDTAAAERCLLSAYEGLRAHGLGIDAARAAALLGRALLGQGRADEAEKLSQESEALAGDDLKAAIAWRGVRAEALAQRGEHAAAVELAREAVEIATATDALLDHADARRALAVALRSGGRHREADAEERRATELWTAKGATLLLEDARGILGARIEADDAAQGRPQRDRTAARRVHPNAATANAARVDAAMAARDIVAVAGALRPDLQNVDHSIGATYGRPQALTSLQMLFNAEMLTFAHEPLATLGESLALCRRAYAYRAMPGDGDEFGPSERVELVLIEADADAQRTHAELFADSRLADAVVRLYERYAEALPDGPARLRAEATARAVAAVLGPFDLERYGAGIAAKVEFVDHRVVSFPSGRGAAELLRSVGSLLETADNVTTRVDDILALCPEAFLVRWTTSGTDRVSRGPFEWQFLRLCVFGADGLLTRAEQFDVENADTALARFGELAVRSGDRTKESSPVARFANAASRSVDAFNRCWEARDWQGLVEIYGSSARLIDRRSFMALDLELSDILATLRVPFDAPVSRWHGDLLATRGDRLALCRFHLEARAVADAGPVELEYLGIVEVDASGRAILNVLFNLDDLDIAYAELDARYAAGEAAPYPLACRTLERLVGSIRARDWEQLASVFTPDLVTEDHRAIGWGTLRSRDEYVARVRALLEMRPDTVFRIDHIVADDPCSVLAVVRWSGAEGDGSFDISGISVSELGADGRIQGWHFYGLDQLDEARARFKAIGSNIGSPPYQGGVRGVSEGQAADRPPPGPLLGKQEVLSSPFAALTTATAATIAADRIHAAFKARDWAAMRAACRPNGRFEDRRRHALLAGDLDWWIADAKGIAETMPDVRYERELVGTFGPRVVLERVLWSGGPSGDRVEVEYLRLTEVEEDGRIATIIGFDLDDAPIAKREAEARFSPDPLRIPPNAASRLRDRLNDAFMARDWDAMRALASGDLVFEDRRKFSVMSGGVEMWIKSAEAVQEASGVAFNDELIGTLGDRIDLRHRVVSGTGPDGGAFESEFILLTEIDADCKLAASLNFDVEARADAFAEAHDRLSRSS